MRDKQRTNKQTLKIEQLSQWKLEAEFRKNKKISKISIKEVLLTCLRGCIAATGSIESPMFAPRSVREGLKKN